MSDPTYSPPNPPDPNANWSNVHNPTPGGQYPPQGQYPPPGYGAQPPQYAPPAAADGLSDTAAGAIAYITIIPAIIFLVVAPYNTKLSSSFMLSSALASE